MGIEVSAQAFWAITGYPCLMFFLVLVQSIFINIIYFQDSALEDVCKSASLISGTSSETGTQYWNPPKVAGEKVYL